MKKIAWYGSAAVASLAVAVTLLLGSTPRTVHAGAFTSMTATAPVQAAGLVETWTFASVGSATTAITTAAYTFPAGFVVPSAPTVVVTGVAGVCTQSTAAVTASQVVTLAISGACNSGGAGLTVTIAGVTNPTTTGTTAAFTGVNSLDTTGGAPTAVIWNTTATKSPTTSVQADGASTVAVTFTPSHTAANTGTATVQNITGTIDTGSVTFTPVAAGVAFGTIAAVTTPTTAVSMATTASVATSGTVVVTVKAPTTAGSTTFILRATPSGGGQAVIIGSTSITWTAASAVSGVPTAINLVATPTSITSTSTSSIVITATDANGAAPLPATMTASTTLGTLTNGSPSCGAAANGTQALQSGTTPTTGICAITLTGQGVGGAAIVTVTIGSVTATKTVQIAGAASTITVSTKRNLGTSQGPVLVDRGSIGNTMSESSDRSQLLIFAKLKDTAGLEVAAGNVTFSLAGPTGHSVQFFQLATAAAGSALPNNGTGVATGSTGAMFLPNSDSNALNAACSVSGSTTGSMTCTDAVSPNALGANSSAATAVVQQTALAALPDTSGTVTVTASYTNPDATIIYGSATFKIVKNLASLTAPTGTIVAVGGTGSMTFIGKDADGNAPISGTNIAFNSPASNVLLVDPVLGTTAYSLTLRTDDAGNVKVNLIGAIAGTTTVVANFGAISSVAAVSVSGSTASVAGAYPAAGKSGLMVASGSFESIIAAAKAGSCTVEAIYVNASAGGFLTYVAGATIAAVNAAATAQYPSGLAANSPVIVACAAAAK